MLDPSEPIDAQEQPDPPQEQPGEDQDQAVEPMPQVNPKDPGRDVTGRFAKGNPGGPGRLPRAMERAYLDATTRGCSLADWTRIVRRAVKDAESGRAQSRASARTFLLKALFGNNQGALVQIANFAASDRKSAMTPEELQKTVREIYGVDIEPKARGLSADDARFWREAVLMGVVGAAPPPSKPPALPSPDPAPDPDPDLAD